MRDLNQVETCDVTGRDVMIEQVQRYNVKTNEAELSDASLSRIHIDIKYKAGWKHSGV